MVRNGDELDTHGVPFQNYQCFQWSRPSSVYHNLINLMLSQTTEDNQLIYGSASHTKADGPFHSSI